MNNQENFDVLLRDNSLLIASNKELTEMSKDAITVLKMAYVHRDNLLNVCLQIFESLHDNSKRNVLEEAWYRGLRDVIMVKNKK